ncbi:MAG: hypothetical protein GC159_13750 [Phycisphaera sp.]|nr:hypothetical protein [Phycisphaera sp.]
MSYLDNGEIRIGVDLNLGGAITYLAPSKQPDNNLVNSFDYGRQIQMSYYSGPVPYAVGDKQPAPNWRHIGWNPIQSGDDHGHRSRVIDQRNDGRELYVKCVPMHWPLDNVPAQCTFETWITLNGPAAHILSRINNARVDTTQYEARGQELPAVYVNAPYHRLMSYTGDKPFTNDALSRMTYTPTAQRPWTMWFATENWAAQVDDHDWGLGVWNADCVRFGGGFSGRPGPGGPSDVNTGYIAPHRREILDHNIIQEYRYALILGKLDAIRGWVYEHAERKATPAWTFGEAHTRMGWTYHDATDAGWPIVDRLSVNLSGDDPQVISPHAFWRAEDAPKLTIDAAFNNGEATAVVYFDALDESVPLGECVVSFEIKPDGVRRRYVVDLSKHPRYRGGMVGLRIDPVSRGGEGRHVDIYAVTLGQ